MNNFIFGDSLTEKDRLDLHIDDVCLRQAGITVSIDFIIVFDHKDDAIRKILGKNFSNIPEYVSTNFRDRDCFIAIFWGC